MFINTQITRFFFMFIVTVQARLHRLHPMNITINTFCAWIIFFFYSSSYLAALIIHELFELDQCLQYRTQTVVAWRVRMWCMALHLVVSDNHSESIVINVGYTVVYTLITHVGKNSSLFLVLGLLSGYCWADRLWTYSIISIYDFF